MLYFSIRTISKAALLGGILFLAACDDDNSSSPVSRAETDQDEELSSNALGSSSSHTSSRFSSSSRSLQDIKNSHFNPKIDYGTMTDPRDGKTYRTVVVDSVTWMAENLNYEAPSIGISQCYSKVADKCELYGRLYSRDAAMNDSRCEFRGKCDLGEGPIQGVCPNGWHIPTQAEVENLMATHGSSALNSSDPATWWRVTGFNTSGLSFVGAGAWNSERGYEELRYYEFMWIYVQSYSQYYLLITSSSVKIWSHPTSEFYLTVRCIKDE